MAYIKPEIEVVQIEMGEVIRTSYESEDAPSGEW